MQYETRRHESLPHGDEHAVTVGEHAVPVDLPPVSTGAVALIALAVLALAGGLFVLGFLPHGRRQAEARAAAAEAADAKPVVEVVRPRPSAPVFDLVLPADVRANQSTAIYARATGYLKPLPPGIDIGARVKAGQVLAEISAPEVDAEQARAALEQANVTVGRANNEFNFNKATYERYEGLARTGGVTQQQLDEKRAAYNIATSSLKAAQATVLAAAANVRRLTELQGFQKVAAPFDGVITARNYDAGALVSATNTGPGRELFRIDQTDTLRAHVSVPQSYATEVVAGQQAELLVRNRAKPAPGTVARTAGAIDTATRTMRVEVDVPNADGALVPGMYGQVRFRIRREQPPLTLPTSALVFGPGGMRIALVEGGKVRYQPVTVGRDFGSEAEIATGLSGEEAVVTNPGEHLVEGIEVKVSRAPAPAGAHASAASVPQPTTRRVAQGPAGERP